MSAPAHAPPPAQNEAEAFLRQYHRETRTPGLRLRLATARTELAQRGRLTLSPSELEHGARLAWRNSTRCIGRAYWPSLLVRDRRHVTAPGQVYAELLTHLETAWQGGHIRSVISVFGPGVRVLSPQLIRYAGYRQPGGTLLGDPANLTLTRQLQVHGWVPPRLPGPFDVLPVAIEAAGQVHLYTLPPEAVHEVAIRHPQYPAMAELGLRWHALPVISNLQLEVAGQRFLCAPFSGWYLGTEIAARNLADRERYDRLPQVAAALNAGGAGLDTRRERSLWRDRALLELNAAVLHSFDAAGVRIADHHSVTRHFVRFEGREAQAGRRVYGRWSWLVPPLSPALTPVWHRQYQDREITPNFFARPDSWPQAAGGRCPFH